VSGRSGQSCISRSGAPAGIRRGYGPLFIVVTCTVTGLFLLLFAIAHVTDPTRTAAVGARGHSDGDTQNVSPR
jgi:hypothetical protein